MDCNFFGTACERRRNMMMAKIAFQVIDPDDCPVEGAVYRLTGANGKYINAITGAYGYIVFRDVCPGTYELSQIATSYGFEPDAAIHTVIVDRSGCVKIGNLPMRCFQSINNRIPPPEPPRADAPTVNAATAATLTISGTGVPGCNVEVTYPNGCVCCAAVRRDSTWSVDVPGEDRLESGDIIQAVQLCPAVLPSEAVSITVT